MNRGHGQTKKYICISTHTTVYCMLLIILFRFGVGLFLVRVHWFFLHTGSFGLPDFLGFIKCMVEENFFVHKIYCVLSKKINTHFVCPVSQKFIFYEHRTPNTQHMYAAIHRLVLAADWLVVCNREFSPWIPFWSCLFCLCFNYTAGS